MKKLAILQSNYIPWKGYFDLIASVDEFIIYDEMQYTKNDWRNRNKIKTVNGLEWITIPVRVENLSQRICDTKIFDKKWVKKHKATLQTNYAKASCFNETKDFIFGLYEQVENKENLSEINYIFIKGICDFLGIKTKISFSTDYILGVGKSERLINLCKQADASVYLSGPSAKDYIDEVLFNENKIDLEWMDYSGYKEYNQLNIPFEHGVSILDLIFNEGDNSRKFLKY
ncbi:WbqC family protein [Flavobacterium luminosum]|uniref:WbqC family protein n=1 Tax=Flavobacterium luminosum TaxID=2949086 RepID=A0ABT0TP11_9FLAO|nr:WbqC family protein [Flavobacterium sp. HXWNR70]MCL9809100.1 WbqC family protein [Flavobacterium sp. HXWNR70]